MFNSDYFLLRTNTSSLICNVTPGISQMNGTFTSQCLPNGQAVLDKFYINKVKILYKMKLVYDSSNYFKRTILIEILVYYADLLYFGLLWIMFIY